MDESNKLLMRLMDKVDAIKSDQDTHIAFSTGKLESIEKQALKTNGRVSKSESQITVLDRQHRKLRTILTTFSSILAFIWTVVTFVLK